MKALETKLAQDFDIVFNQKNLLETAFTHTSYANEHRLLNISHNERLEFLGDAALQLVISNYLYRRYPDKPEGEMSKLRSMIVREESLAGFTKVCGFEKYIRLGKGEERSGGRKRATILGDLWEAFLGALYLDQGLPAVEKFLGEVMIPQVEKGDFDRVTDYKTALQERLQIHGTVDIAYTVIEESGPAHSKIFTVLVTVDGKELSSGTGKSKKLAEQAAAEVALKQLGN
ncbi:ribonuclease III [Streptococcus dentiloxodontae]